MKVSELTDGLLDYWVARAEGWTNDGGIDGEPPYWVTDTCAMVPVREFKPSDDWAEGGPIIERQKIGVTFGAFGGLWHALMLADGPFSIKHTTTGATPLEAAMRAYVRSKFGEEVSDEGI